jgi:DNA repair protein RecO (recombination protein O)
VVPTLIDMAVCVRQWDWSETSQTVSLFSREHGLIRAVAKGSRRADARFSGGLEVPTAGEMVAIVKTGPVLGTLTGWDLRETFPAMRRSLSAFYAGMYGVDLAHHALQERDPHPALFDALLALLRTLGGPAGSAGDRLAALRFQWAALEETGYRPELDLDVLKGAPLADSRLYVFSPSLGGFTASGNAGDEARAWRVRAETVRVLRAISQDRAGNSAPPPEEGVLRAGRLFAAYLREILGRDLASAAPVFGVAPS